MNCPKCGQQLNDNAKFCSGCGYKIPEKTTTQVNETYGLTNRTLDAKLTSMLSYLSLMGWLVAYLLGDHDNEVSKFHLNQGIVVNLFGLLSCIPYIGALWGIFIVVMQIMGIYYANKGEAYRLPIFGGMDLLSKMENKY